MRTWSNGPVEIVDLPIKSLNMVDFSIVFLVTVYQAGYTVLGPYNGDVSAWSAGSSLMVIPEQLKRRPICIRTYQDSSLGHHQTSNHP